MARRRDQGWVEQEGAGTSRSYLTAHQLPTYVGRTKVSPLPLTNICPTTTKLFTAALQFFLSPTACFFTLIRQSWKNPIFCLQKTAAEEQLVYEVTPLQAGAIVNPLICPTAGCLSLLELNLDHGRLVEQPTRSCCPLVRRSLQTEENPSGGSADPARTHRFLQQPAPPPPVLLLLIIPSGLILVSSLMLHPHCIFIQFSSLLSCFLLF